MLREMPKATANQYTSARSHDDTKQIPTLEELGLNKNQSSRSQFIAGHGGVVLRELPKSEGQLFRGSSLEPRGQEETYDDIGIAKTTAYRWQAIADSY